MSLTLQRRGLVDEYNGYQFRRESMAQDSAGKLIYPHNARFEQGPFGSDKAILVEEGTTNQIFVAGYLSWFANLNIGDSTDRSVGGGTIRVTRLGEHRYRAEVISDCTFPNLVFTNAITWPANQPHTISAYILDYYEAPGTTGRLGLGRTSFGSPSLHGAGGLGRKTFTHQHTEDVNVEFAVRAAVNDLIKAGTYIEWEFAQAELNKPYATTFTPSVRADESLTVPIEGLLSLEQGTIELWYNDNGINKNKIVFKCGDLKFNPVSVTKGWHLISVIWDGVDTNYYIDKELVSTTNSPTELGSLYLGSDGDIDFINSLISHLRLSSIARTAEQLAPLDAPPTVDEYTTLYLPFNGADGTRAAKSISI